MKQAVAKILKGRNRQEQSLWVAFRSHFLFEADYCAPGKGQEKGGSRIWSDTCDAISSFLCPRWRTFAALNAYLLIVASGTPRERTRWGKTVHDLWLEEKEKLRPLPEKMPEACVLATAKVNRRQMVRFATNWYSVPPQYVGKTVTVKAFVFQVIIALPETVIAAHARSYERDEEVLDPHHYLPVLLRKPGAFERATPIVTWPLPPVYDTVPPPPERAT